MKEMSKEEFYEEIRSVIKGEITITKLAKELQTDSGTLNNKISIVILDMTIKNKDAVGLTKKNEFTVSNIALRGGKNVSQYNVAYFSESASVDSEQPLYYNLEQGDSKDVKIGYLILKDDMENMVGVVSDSDIQFMIR